MRTLRQARRGQASRGPEGANAAPGQSFRHMQATISSTLDGALDGVRAIAKAGGVDLGKEDLGLGLWCVDHAAGTMRCLATADRQLKDHSGLIDNPLELESRWMAVEAVTYGITRAADPAVYASRWRLVRGVPIVLADPAGVGRVVVGAMTLTSQEPAASSGVGDAAARGVLNAIDGYLAYLGTLMFEA